PRPGGARPRAGAEERRIAWDLRKGVPHSTSSARARPGQTVLCDRAAFHKAFIFVARTVWPSDSSWPRPSTRSPTWRSWSEISFPSLTTWVAPLTSIDQPPLTNKCEPWTALTFPSKETVAAWFGDVTLSSPQAAVRTTAKKVAARPAA